MRFEYDTNTIDVQIQQLSKYLCILVDIMVIVPVLLYCIMFSVSDRLERNTDNRYSCLCFSRGRQLLVSCICWNACNASKLNVRNSSIFQSALQARFKTHQLLLRMHVFSNDSLTKKCHVQQPTVAWTLQLNMRQQSSKQHLAISLDHSLVYQE